MTILAGYLIDQAAILAQDKIGLTFPADEWLAWLNDAQRAVVDKRPEASTAVVIAKLDEGVKQFLPATASRLVDVPRNVVYGLASVSIAAADASNDEGQSGSTAFTFTVTRSNQVGVAVSVDYVTTGTGTHPASASDFVGGAFPYGTIEFAAGDTVKTLTIQVQGDLTVESDETFTVTLNNPNGCVIGTATATGTITNDDCTVSIAATSADKDEGDSGATNFTFTVTRTGSTTGAVSVDWVVAGSGGSPALASDFVGGAFPSGTLTIADGVSSGVITVQVAGDTTHESDKAFSVTISDPVNTSIVTATATGTIRNDDPALYDLYAWGNGRQYGAYGDGVSVVSTQAFAPVLVLSGVDIAQFAGSDSAGYVTSDGRLFVWGRNHTGQLGLGDTTDRNAPVEVSPPSGLTWTKIDFTQDGGMARDSAGHLWFAGNRSGGVDGSGTEGGTTTTWTDTGMVAADFDLSFKHGVGKQSSLAYTWGADLHGGVSRASPEVFATIYAFGNSGTTATKSGGSLLESGLGDVYTVIGGGATSPVLVNCWAMRGGALAEWQYTDPGSGVIYNQLFGAGTSAANMGGGTYTVWEKCSPALSRTDTSPLVDWVRTSDLDSRVMFQLNGSTTIYTAGENFYGECGRGDSGGVALGQGLIDGGSTGWMDGTILSGPSSRAGIGLKQDGTLWGWGESKLNGLGNATPSTTYTATQIGTSTGWVGVSGTGSVGFAWRIAGT